VEGLDLAAPEQCFNSRLVRLVGASWFTSTFFREFQFQIGAIGSLHGLIDYWCAFLFQFQIGAIGSRKRQTLATGTL